MRVVAEITKMNFKKLLTDKENYGKLFWLSKNGRNS